MCALNIAAVLAGSSIDPCCCGGTCQLECRERGGVAELCGFSEWTNPSNPPKKYRTLTASGLYYNCYYSDVSCATLSAGDSGEMSGANSFSAANCAKTVGTVFLIRQGPDATCPATAFLSSSQGVEAIPGTPNDGVAHEQTATLWRRYGLATCYPVEGHTRAVSHGGNRLELSDEDTEQDAINRLLAPQPWPSAEVGWILAGSASCLANICCTSRYSFRQAQFKFVYYEAQFRLKVLLAQGTFLTVRLNFYRQAYGSSDIVLFQTYEYTAEGNSEGKWQTTGDVPIQRGYATWAGECTTHPYQA